MAPPQPLTEGAGHVPALAAGDSAGPRRSLILAGGGMRVAYQAGVLRALEEEGLRFAHGDGTSGGTINLAMLLSGIAPEEMCERWRTLRARDFVSLPSPARLLRGPRLLGFGNASGLVERVFPHLGIDAGRIRAAQGMDGTFNVCDFATKTNVAVPHTEVDVDVLVAGVTLPILMPPVRRRGRLLVDSVWIKDANPTEAVRRGCDELWLVWCIGNSGAYRPGVFAQYVHMIELSANGALFEELAALRAGADPLPRLHVIRPVYPLPLDPDFYAGRIDADALVASGYRDARRYLERGTRAGVPWDESATRMRDQELGVAFQRRLRGGRVRVEVRDLARFRAEGAAELAGRLDDGRLAEDGRFRLEGRRQIYELDAGGERVVLGGRLRDLPHLLRTLQGTGPFGLWRRAAAAASFAWLLLRGRRYPSP